MAPAMIWWRCSADSTGKRHIMAIPVQPVGARAVLEWMEAHHTLPYAEALNRYWDGAVGGMQETVNARYTCQNELLNG